MGDGRREIIGAESLFFVTPVSKARVVICSCTARRTCNCSSCFAGAVAGGHDLVALSKWRFKPMGAGRAQDAEPEQEDINAARCIKARTRRACLHA